MECSFSPKFRSSIRPSTNSRSGLQLVRRYSRTVQSSSELGRVAMCLLSPQTNCQASLLRIRRRRAFFFALDRDAQRAEKVQVVGREGASGLAFFRGGVTRGSGLLGGNFVQAD